MVNQLYTFNKNAQILIDFKGAKSSTPSSLPHAYSSTEAMVS